MTFQFVPGPWEVADAGSDVEGFFSLEEYFVRRPGDDVAICGDIIDPDTSEPSLATATLIAAAPDLLDACRTALEFYDAAFSDEIGNTRATLRAAIARATGEKETT